MEKNILNIYCPGCGAPAQFDIVSQTYLCRHCGGRVSIEDARKEKDLILRKGSENAGDGFKLELTSCTGCGAVVVFEENEALSKCEFCGRSLVRKRYIRDPGLPHYVIPFGVTQAEAEEKLSEWCVKNKGRSEAGHLKQKISSLKGYYLPYEMVRGPVHCRVNKCSENTVYEAGGYLNGEFINCSKQLDNLLLDAMEPFDTDELKEFDFAYVAGHRVKVSDIDKKAVSERLKEEAGANYTRRMEQLWGTRSISVETSVEPVIRFPVLLPVYFISDGEVKAAVNGQTGKVSVCAEKPGRYLSLPWWLKGLLVLLLALGVTFAAMSHTGFDRAEALYVTGMLGLFYLIVFTCMFAGGGSTAFGFSRYRRIFNSGEQTYRRDNGRLVLSDEVLKRRIEEPVFMQELDGRLTPVSYTFRSFKRVVFMTLVSIAVIFLPVIIALFVNGFDFARLKLGGSAVWFCITVPVVPIYLVRFGIQWLYDNPRVYIFTDDGKRRRYRKKRTVNREKVKEGIKVCLRLLFVPPLCLLTWFILGSMITMVCLTAFGF